MSQTFGKLISTARRAAYRTQVETAAYIGKSHPTVVAIEQGKTLPRTAEEAMNLARFVRADEFVALQLYAAAKLGAGLETAASVMPTRRPPCGFTQTRRRLPREIEHAAKDLTRVLTEAMEHRLSEVFPITEVLAHEAWVSFVQDRVEADVRLQIEDSLEWWYAATSVADGELLVQVRDDVWEAAAGGNYRARFALAHILMHVVLHGAELVSEGSTYATGFETSSSAAIKANDPKHQANVGAAALLMPRDSVLDNLHRISQYAVASELSYRFQTPIEIVHERLATMSLPWQARPDAD